MRIAHIRNGVVVNVIEAGSVWSTNGEDSFSPSEEASVGWLMVNGGLQPPPVDYIVEAEDFVKNSFTPLQLLQCKVWLDLIPHEATPKLMSLFQWTAAVTAAALRNSVDFPAQPVTFREVAVECAPLLP